MRIRSIAYSGPTNLLVHTRPLSEESLVKVSEDRQKNFHAPGTYQWKVVDTDAENEIISCAQWTLHNYNGEESEEREEEEGEAKADGIDDTAPRDPRWKSKRPDAEPLFLPPEVNLKVLKALLGPLRAANEEIMGARPYLMLNTLSTHPEHYRRGCGSLLVKWGVETADELGIEAYLDTSMMGRKLYERFGFELVREVRFDREEWGGEGVDWHGVS